MWALKNPIIPNEFTFSPVSLEDVRNEIMKLDVKKLSSSISMPATILKQSAHTHLPFLTNSINILYMRNLCQMD